MAKKIKCPTCGTVNPADSNFCSKCSSPLNANAQAAATEQGPAVVVQKKKGKGCLIAALVVVAIIVIIIIAVVAGTYHVAKTVENNTVGITSSSWQDKFDVSNLQLGDADAAGIQHVTGTLTNKTTKQYGYLQVEINEYDASGAQVGSTLANVNNLEAKGTWKIDAITTSQNVKSVKLKDVTGFATVS